MQLTSPVADEMSHFDPLPPVVAVEAVSARVLPPLGSALGEDESFAARAGAMVIASVFIAFYFFFILQYWAPAHTGVDQNGYLVGGKMLAHTGSMGFKPEDPLGFVGGMWVRNETTGINYPKYPIGLPLLYACVLWAFGHAGIVYAHLISPISAALAVLGMYFLARQFVGTFASLLAMLLLAFSQITLLLADNPNSHASCLAFVVWGVFVLLRFWETGDLWRGLLGGFLLGYAATIRYTDGLLVLLVGLVMLSMIRWNHPRIYARFTKKSIVWIVAALALVRLLVYLSWPIDSLQQLIHRQSVSDWLSLSPIGGVRYLVLIGVLLIALIFFRFHFRALSALCGWLIPVTYLVAFNLVAMGTPTGYDTTNESKPGSAFTLDHIGDNWEKLIRQVHDAGLFFTLPLGILGLVLAFRVCTRRGIFLWLWLIPGTVTYMAYYWAPERGVAYLRFFLTLLPPLVVGVGIAIQMILTPSVTRTQRFVNPLAGGLVIGIACVMSLYRSLLGLEDGVETGQGMEAQYRQQVNQAALDKVVTRIVPSGAAVFSTANVLNDLQFVGDYDCFNTEYFSIGYLTRLATQDETIDPNDPDPLQPARRKYMLTLLNGKNADELAQLQMDLIAKNLTAGRRVFVILNRASAELLTRRYERRGSTIAYKTVGTYNELPRLHEPDLTSSTDPRARAMMGPGGPGNRVRGGGGIGMGGGGGGGARFAGGPPRQGFGGRDFRGMLPQVWEIIELTQKSVPQIVPAKK